MEYKMINTTRGRIRAGLLILIFLLSLAGCEKKSTGFSDGSYSAAEQGFGGDVTVSLTVSKGKISNVDITGDKETPNVGQAAFSKLAESIVDSQSADIEAVSGASFTSKAVIAAAEKAVAAAKGESVESTVAVSMADGTYKASTWAFSPNFPMEVSVKVDDNKFTDIEVLGGNDTKPILQSAIDLLIPRMIEKQSVTIDSVTGASASSNGIKAATEDCLVQAIKAAGGDPKDVKAFYVSSEKKSETLQMDTDILVVGMGGSGIATAVRAAEELYAANGNNPDAVHVLGIDKAGKYGGTSAVTSSPMSINPPSFVEKNGGKDYVDVDALKAAWIEYTEGDAKEWAIDYMMEESGKATDWLMGLGFDFGAPMQGLSEPYEAVVAYGGQFGIKKEIVAAYFDSIMKHYAEIGGEYMLETSATDLMTNAAGDVIGVTAENADGTVYEIHADSVVLATGGFAGSSEMTNRYLSTEYYPLTGDAYNHYGMRQNDGAMIQAAIDKGAATYNIGVPPMSHIGGAVAVMHEYEVTPIEGSFDLWTGREATRSLNDIPMMMAVAPNAMAVNSDGVRFVDETALGSYGNWQAGPRFYTIWSNEMIDEIKEKGLRFDSNGLFVNQGGWPINTPIDNVYEVLDKAVSHGIAVKADSLGDLAKALDMNSDTLVSTVKNYNAYCDSLENPADGITKSSIVYDLSGQPSDNKNSTFEKVEGDGPYYTVIGSPWVYSTTGGLDINEKFQVLGKDGRVISGLYAVGTDSIGVMLTEKKEYVAYGGAAQGWAFTSGYLAGAIVADTVK